LRCRRPLLKICVLALSGRVEAGHSRRTAVAHFGVSVSFVVNLMTAYRLRGSLAPKPLGGRRHAKLAPHRLFLLRRVVEMDDITMPELAETSPPAVARKPIPPRSNRRCGSSPTGWSSSTRPGPPPK
jgi:hypothetical protein